MEGWLSSRKTAGMVALLLMSGGTGLAAAQTESAPATTAQAASPATAAPAAAQGGTIHGVVIAGAAGKPGGIPLPGVAITATNTLTGKKYSTSTDIDGQFAMKIPRNGRYVVRVELAGFAAATQEVVLTGVEAQAAAQGITINEKPTDFGMELASRAAADEARQSAAASGATLTQGTQNLSLSAGGDTTDVTAGGGNSGAALPSLAGVGGSAEAANDAVTVSGQSGQMNGLANFSEDDIRQRIEDRVAEARANGQLGAGGDPTDAIVGMLGGMLGGGGGGRGGPGGGGRGGGGDGRGGGGSGAFRNFNPAQPHGSVFYQGGNSALNSAPWSPTLTPLTNPSAYSNRFGASIAGSPYIPGLTKPNTKQFVFLNLTGQKNLNAFLPNPVRVPTLLERTGDFSQSTIGGEANATKVELYDPTTGTTTGPLISQNKVTAISPTALALLNEYYPAPNIPTNAQGYNYQTISNAGSNNVAINTRYVRTLGGSTATPFGNFGGGGGGRGGRTSGPPSLRQNINIGYNYSHSASDLRNIFLPLGGASESDGNGLSVGYTVSYGRLSNNASVNWNRLNSETRNYFTDTNTNPTTALGLGVPNNSGGFADPRFYNGLPAFTLTNYQSLTNTTPSKVINQTISFSDFVAYRHSKHNYRLGFDIRRVHRDSIGGNNPLGTYAFTGYATADAADQASGNAGNSGASGDAFADFLLGLPQETEIQANLYKIYLRENVYDWYVTDDWRVASNLTVNYGIRYEYFGPYSEKDNQIVNLAPNSDFTSFTPVTPGQGGYPHGLVNPDHLMYAPRFGFAWRPKNAGWTKDTVVRGGYSINYNTGQYAVFAQKLSGQEPYAVVQTNTFASGCTTVTPTTPSSPTTMTLAKGFGCSTNTTIENNWAVDKNYRLGTVQLYNLNIQRTIPLQIVLNIGYNGSKGSNLDLVGSPNGVPTSINPLGVTTSTIAPFDYEESTAGSHSNQLVISAQQRQHKGIALGATYTYSHTIDNASGVGGAIGAPVQNLFNLAAEEGNSSFDQRHNLTGNWLIELPFGPNRAFLNKGGFWAHALDGYSISGTFTFASGTYYTPTYSGNSVESLSGGVYTQRPDRNFSQPLKGPRNLGEWFNTSAFSLPTVDGTKNTPTTYGTASQGSIEGPGTVSVNASLSRTFQLGDTRSFEARVTASNVFNTVQYSGINVNENSANFGEVTSAAAMRALQVQARYRF